MLAASQAVLTQSNLLSVQSSFSSIFFQFINFKRIKIFPTINQYSLLRQGLTWPCLESRKLNKLSLVLCYHSVAQEDSSSGTQGQDLPSTPKETPLEVVFSKAVALSYRVRSESSAFLDACPGPAVRYGGLVNRCAVALWSGRLSLSVSFPFRLLSFSVTFLLSSTSQ